MNNLPMPRFQGRAFETDKGWSWEILVTFLGSGSDGLTM